MSVFGVKVQDSEISETFFREVNERITGHNLLKHPFSGEIVKVGEIHVVYMEPLIANVPRVITFPTVAMLIVFGFHYWQIPAIIVSSCWFFYTRWFFYLILKKGLKRAKYDGKLELISPEEIIKKEVLNGSGRHIRDVARKTPGD